ncbi:hypothetical protein D6779_00025, partial [Candidatus Parcubacteria bacterium]
MNKRILAGILISLGLLLAACAKGDNENIPAPATAHIDTSPTGTETPVPTPTRTQLPPTPTPTDVPIVNIVIDGNCEDFASAGLDFPIRNVTGFVGGKDVAMYAVINDEGIIATCITRLDGFRGIPNDGLKVSRGMNENKFVYWPLGIGQFLDENGQIIPGSLIYDADTGTLEFAFDVSGLYPDYGDRTKGNLDLRELIVNLDPKEQEGDSEFDFLVQTRQAIIASKQILDGIPVGDYVVVDMQTAENAAIMSQHDLAVNFELSDGYSMSIFGKAPDLPGIFSLAYGKDGFFTYQISPDHMVS